MYIIITNAMRPDGNTQWRFALDFLNMKLNVSAVTLHPEIQRLEHFRTFNL